MKTARKSVHLYKISFESKVTLQNFSRILTKVAEKLHCRADFLVEQLITPEEGIVVGDAGIRLSFARIIKGHVKKSTGTEPLLDSELINNLKRHQRLQAFFNTFAGR